MKSQRTTIWRKGQESGVCTQCETNRPIDQFRVSGGYRTHICSVCRPDGTSEGTRKRWSSYYTENAQLILKRHRTKREKAKAIVLARMGEVCVCCGETEKAFLSVDHINNDGAERRKRDAKEKRIYTWLIQNNFPAGFQMLCANCNQGKRMNNGICPHREGSQTRAQARSRIGGEMPEVRKDRNIVGASVKAEDVTSLAPWGLQ